MIWITADDIILLHSRIIKGSGGLDGLRDRASLEAAVAAPMQSFGEQDLFPSMALLQTTLSSMATRGSEP